MSNNTANSLVSIVIPCFNCARWVRQAIQSCLDQTYSNIEIVAVDDGSTDETLNVLRRFVPRIHLATGPNSGGNHARNTGFALSAGEYIQFLDADDYLGPEKIARQVEFLEATDADAVYGDWRYRRHLPDITLSYLDKIEISGAQQDILASLLSGTWWVAPGAILYRRRVVDKVGGWDETLCAAQDRDFLTSVALSGAIIGYQPGCNFVYRQYGATTVSANLNRWIEGHFRTLKKSRETLAAGGRLIDEYKVAIARGYFELMRGAIYTIDARPSYSNFVGMLDRLVGETLMLCPDFRPTDESGLFNKMNRLYGLKRAVRLFWLRMMVRRFILLLRRTFLLRILLRLRQVKLEREGALSAKD